MVLGRQRSIRQLAARPEVAELLGKLRATTARLATLSFAVLAADKARQRAEEIAALSEEKEKLEGQLAAAAQAAGIAGRTITTAEIQAALPAETVLIDFLEFRFGQLDVASKTWKTEERLAAFVVQPKGDVAMFDLGAVQPIRAAIDAWRADYGATADGKKAAALLRERLWLTLEGRFEGATTVLLSPDGALGKLAFAALPGKQPGTYLIEQYVLTTVPSPQSLLDAAQNKQSADSAGGLLVVAGVNYDRGVAPLQTEPPPNALASRAAGEARFAPLAGTQTESAAIRQLFSETTSGRKFTPLESGAASQDAFVQAAPGHRYLHLATHGYFAAPRFKSALARSLQASSAEGAFVSNQSLSGYHPGLLSGLALAGANEPTDADDGILTAEEVGSLNLSGVDLAVLSACETGLGETAGGEGLIGLQRAFQVAGTRTVVASLWSVPDQATKRLMVRFYENLWKRKLPKGEALREAQLWMIRQGREQPDLRRELVARGLEEISAKPTVGRTLPPYFWAAFVLSGDWK
jgi:CHAT domain-containing protein